MRIPGTPLVVDSFDRNSRSNGGSGGNAPPIFLLTHMHQDHTVGLTPSWNFGRILCSTLTRDLLLHTFGFQNAHLVEALPVGETTVVDLVPNGSVTMSVTVCSANHCPGSVMFLLEGYFGRILCTGDFRFDQDEALFSPLFEVLARGPQLSLLLLDNTYLHPSHTFKSRVCVSDWLVIALQAYPPTTRIYVGIDTLGKEELLCKLAVVLNSKVVVCQRRMHSLRTLGIDSFFTTTDLRCPSARIIVVSKRKLGTSANPECFPPGSVCVVPTAFLSITGATHRNNTRASNRNGDHHDSHSNHTSFEPWSASGSTTSAWLDGDIESRSLTMPKWSIHTLRSQRDAEALHSVAQSVTCVPGSAAGRRSLPNLIFAPYSLHSSYPELCAFVRKVNPLWCVPCSVRNVEAVKQVKVLMSRLFGPERAAFDGPLPLSRSIPPELDWTPRCCRSHGEPSTTATATGVERGSQIGSRSSLTGIADVAVVKLRLENNLRRIVRRSGKRKALMQVEVEHSERRCIARRTARPVVTLMPVKREGCGGSLSPINDDSADSSILRHCEITIAPTSPSPSTAASAAVVKTERICVKTDDETRRVVVDERARPCAEDQGESWPGDRCSWTPAEDKIVQALCAQLSAATRNGGHRRRRMLRALLRGHSDAEIEERGATLRRLADSGPGSDEADAM